MKKERNSIYSTESQEEKKYTEIGEKNHIEVFRSYEKKPEKISIKTGGVGHVGDVEMRDALVEAHFSGRGISPTAREGRAGVAVLAKAMESEKTGKVTKILWPDKKYR